VAAAAEVEAAGMRILPAGQGIRADVHTKMCNGSDTGSRVSGSAILVGQGMPARSPRIYIGDVTGPGRTAVSPIPEVEGLGKSVQKFSTSSRARQFSTT
jgi:hypothetical protein